MGVLTLELLKLTLMSFFFRGHDGGLLRLSQNQTGKAQHDSPQHHAQHYSVDHRLIPPSSASRLRHRFTRRFYRWLKRILKGRLHTLPPFLAFPLILLKEGFSLGAMEAMMG
jgi:hypothetical protein